MHRSHTSGSKPNIDIGRQGRAVCEVTELATELDHYFGFDVARVEASNGL